MWAAEKRQARRRPAVSRDHTHQESPRSETRLSPILTLQRTIGNQAVLQLLRNHPEILQGENGLRDLARPSAMSAQRKPDNPLTMARFGVGGTSSRLPYRDQIQAAFGHHDISGVTAHLDPRAAQASRALGARAYATGESIAFREQPDLHAAAHEAAHIVQQRSAITPKGGVGEPGDIYENHASAVAQRVVAGQSAQDLLDTSSGGKPSVASTAPAGAVQLLLAGDVGKEALAEVDQSITSKLTTNADMPKPGYHLFSGSMTATLTAKITPGSEMQAAFDSIGSRATNGTPESMIEGVFPIEKRELYNSDAFGWMLGSQTSSQYIKEPVSQHLEKLIRWAYDTEPLTLVGGLNYNRGPNDDFHLRIDNIPNDSVPNVQVEPRSLRLVGSQELRTRADAEFFAQWTVKKAPNPFDRILGNLQETETFLALLRQTGPEGVSVWYDYVRGKVWDEAAWRKWFDATFSDAAHQQNVIQSLQAIYFAGAPAANNDLEALVNVIRSVLQDPKTTATKRAAVQSRLLGSILWSKLKIDETKVPRPDKIDSTAVTKDANFDLLRTAGKVAAQSKLLPLLGAAFDPIAFAKHYPLKESPTLGVALTDIVISDASKVSDLLVRFIDQEVGSTLSGGAHTSDPAQQDLGVGAARLGALEAITEATKQHSGPASVAAHIGMHKGLATLDAEYAGKRGVTDQDVAHVANQAAAGMLDVIFADHKAILAEAEKLAAGDKQRSDNLRDFGNLIADYDVRKDLGALRKAASEAQGRLGKEIDIKTVLSLLASQAAVAKAETITAFENAFAEYKTTFLEKHRGPVQEQD
jgi:hypothetical protein